MTATDRAHPPLHNATVHVWTLGLADGDRGHFWELLNPEERSRADRFRVPKAQEGYVRTRGALRLLLGRYLNRDPRNIALETNGHGKPRLAGSGDGEGLVFNISHSEDRALLAFTRDTALGVDLESVRPRHDLEGLSKMCLAEAERMRWEESGPEARLPEFIRLWVCKEAFVKAVGRGIGMGVKRAVVNAGFNGFLDIPSEYGTASDWRLREWATGDFRAALVFRGGERDLRIFRCP